MNDSLLLLSNFIKKPKEVGAIAPSSKSLTREIIKNVDFKNCRSIVELGPGVGTFTKVILKKASEDARLICLEVNKKFCKYITQNFHDDRLFVLNEGADTISKNLKKFNLGKADCIISGLPFRNFSDAKKIRIIKEVKKSLCADGRFVLFQYTNGLSKLLESHFTQVKKKFIALNIPPTFVYVCRK